MWWIVIKVIYVDCISVYFVVFLFYEDGVFILFKVLILMLGKFWMKGFYWLVFMKRLDVMFYVMGWFGNFLLVDYKYRYVVLGVVCFDEFENVECYLKVSRMGYKGFGLLGFNWMGFELIFVLFVSLIMFCFCLFFLSIIV